MRRLILFAFAVLAAAAMAGDARCQISSATEAAARELIDVMLRQGGRQAATELTEMGGELAVRQLLENAISEGGEGLVERIAQYGSRYGPSALKAVERSPSQMIRALDRISPDLIEGAIRAAARQPDVMARLVAAYGKDALEVAAKHPGVGASLAEKLGGDGIRIGRQLTTDRAVTFARFADDIAALPTAERNRLLDAMMKAPSAVLDVLEAHPKVLLTAGGVATIIALKDNLFGSTATSTNHDAPPAGLVERVIFGLGERFTGPVMVAVVIVTGGILYRVVIGLGSTLKFTAIRSRTREARLAAEIARLPKTHHREPGQ